MQHTECRFPILLCWKVLTPAKASGLTAGCTQLGLLPRTSLHEDLAGNRGDSGSRDVALTRGREHISVHSSTSMFYSNDKPQCWKKHLEFSYRSDFPGQNTYIDGSSAASVFSGRTSVWVRRDEHQMASLREAFPSLPYAYAFLQRRFGTKFSAKREKNIGLCVFKQVQSI